MFSAVRLQGKNVLLLTSVSIEVLSDFCMQMQLSSDVAVSVNVNNAKLYGKPK